MKNNSQSGYVWPVVLALFVVIATVGMLAFCRVETVKGNEYGVKETFSGGVDTNVLPPKTYFVWRGFADIIQYDASSQVYNLEKYLVQSSEGQDMYVSANLRYRINPDKLINLHKRVRQDFEKKLINPVLLRVIKDESTKKKAIDAYSGQGLVDLQTAIQSDLSNIEGELAAAGIIVENFVIRHIELDPNYISEIKQKQVATQRQLRAVEEQRAAEAQALVAKALAQADLNKAVVEAQRDFEVGLLKSKQMATNQVLQAQADNEKAILAAKGEQQKLMLEAEGQKQKLTLEGEGNKMASIAKAEGVLALGKAEAEAQKLRLQAYAVPGADAFVKVEVSKNLASGMQNIHGYLPENLSVNLLTDNFTKAVNALTGQPVVIPAK